MKYNRASRRMFLQGSGSALVTIPFLTSLLPRELWAQATPGTIKRFITVDTTYDLGHNTNWIPNNGSLAQQIDIPQPNRVVTGTNGHHSVRYQPLREFAPTNSSVLAPLYGASLSPYLESMNILRSLDLPYRYGHGHAHILGGILPDDAVNGFKRIPTIDYILNSNKVFNPNGRPNVTTQNSGGNLSQSLSGTTVASTSSTDNYFNALYNAMFSNGSFPESGATQVINPKAGVLNRVLDDYTRTRNSKNISLEDKVILDNVFDKFSDIQRSFTATSGGQCKYRDFFTTHPGKTDYYTVTNESDGKALADLVTVALMCDSVRTLSFQFDTSYGLIFDGLEFDHQVTSHSPFEMANGKYQWQHMGGRQALIIKNFIAPLVQNLSSAIDTNGKSILYNSLLNVNYECGQVHGWGSIPTILFGNAGGAFTSGNYIDYADRPKGIYDGADTGDGIFTKTQGSIKFTNNWYGVSHNRLHVSILQAMGLTPAEYEDNALNAGLYNRTDIGDLNKSITNIGGYGYALPKRLDDAPWENFRERLTHYDLKQFKYKLPIL